MSLKREEESYVAKAVISGNVCALIAALLNPFDVVKIRIQNNSSLYPWHEKTMIGGILALWKKEGIRGWCHGVNASILRELFYSSIRIGAYEPILHFLSRSSTAHEQNTLPSPFIKYFSGLLSGGIGSALANPTDLVKVNFQAYIPGVSPPLPYSTTIGAFLYIFTHYGVKGLYKGWVVTSTRSAILTSAQMGSYDTIKNNILRREFDMPDGYFLHFVASMLAGLITTTAANPVDVIKTRYMSDQSGKYRNPIDCAITTYKEGGIKIFFKGWVPSYCRLGPYIVFSFILIEQIRMYLGYNTI